MAALTGTNGVLLIQNTSDTFTAQGASANQPFSPQAGTFYASAASHLVLQDADGVTVLELAAGAGASVVLDNHFFMGMRPWKTPIKASTLTAGGYLRLYL